MITLSLYSFIIFTTFFSWTVVLNIIALMICPGPFSKRSLFKFPFFHYGVAIAMSIIWFYNLYFAPYFILLSALAITICTDSCFMLISRFTSLYLVPIGVVAAHYNYLPITGKESIAAAVVSYLTLYSINKVYYLLKKENGIGQGDFELLACIASFTGFLGAWFTVLYGSIIGTLSSSMIMLYQRKYIQKVPFGAYLAVGAILFIIFEVTIVSQLNCLF